MMITDSVKEEWLKILDEKEKLFSGSKLMRFINQPQKYFNSIWVRKISFPLSKKGTEKTCKTFWGDSFTVVLPAGNDIYLAGTKSFFAEIRQAKFMIKQLKQGETYMDVGAHFGFFSLLASRLVGDEGKIFSFEPTRSTFAVLTKNLLKQKNSFLLSLAVSSTEGEVEFFEFNQFLSENNSAKPDENKVTAKDMQRYMVKTISLSKFCANEKITPSIIKIDAEGLELEVVSGMKKLLELHSPKIIMEFAREKNENYFSAAEILKSFGYKSFLIDKNGNKEASNDLTKNLKEMNAESDNVVFMKN